MIILEKYRLQMRLLQSLQGLQLWKWKVSLRWLGMKSLSKGVKVDVLEGVVTVALALNLKYGYSIMDVSAKVQEKVKASIENMTGLTVADVNIRVAGVDMEN